VAAPFQLKTLPSTMAVVLESAAAEVPTDGLALGVWVSENGYVQIAPTRMEYISTDGQPSSMRTRIIIPIRKRASGLSLR
jgi:hypothetical protein